MGDLLARASAWLDRTHKANVSQTVVYRRGSATVSVQATFGSVESYEQDEESIAHRYRARAFLIAAADLVLGGGQVEPRRGDRIEHGGKVYEVLPTETEPEWRWSDADNEMYRIHAKQVA